ncbi:MAG: hypothetical protein ACMUHX_11040 [bacterium]
MVLKKVLLNLFILLIISSLCFSLSHASERLINFQGHLTDQQGNALDGTYNIKFSIYPSDPNAGSLWTEEHNDVSVSNGVVNVLLGSITNFDEPVKITFGEERYLGITIDCDHDPNTEEPEMTPRQKILPAIYAYNADRLDGKDSIEFTTPERDAGRPGVVENLYEGNIRLMDKYVKLEDLSKYIIPKMGIILWRGTSCPSGYTRVAELNGRFPKGAVGNPGGFGGSSKHSHTGKADLRDISHTHIIDGYTDEAKNQWDGGYGSHGAMDSHGHHLRIRSGNMEGNNPHDHTLTINDADSLPPYYDVIFCQKD